MKKLFKLSLLILVPFFGGMILQIVGSGTVAYVGKMLMSYGTFATAILIFVIGMVMMIKGKWNDEETNGGNATGKPISEIDVESNKQAEQSDGELDVSALEEERKLNDINSSYGYESRLKQSQFIADHSANAYRNSTPKQKVLGWLFFAFLVITFTLIPLMFSFGINLGGYICMGLFGGTLIIAIIVKVIVEKTGLSTRAVRRHPEDWVTVKGMIKCCSLSSSSSVGGGSRHSSVRVIDVTYRITAIADGKEYHGYSKRFYNEGEVTDIIISVRGDTDRMYMP